MSFLSLRRDLFFFVATQIKHGISFAFTFQNRAMYTLVVFSHGQIDIDNLLEISVCIYTNSFFSCEIHEWKRLDAITVEFEEILQNIPYGNTVMQEEKNNNNKFLKKKSSRYVVTKLKYFVYLELHWIAGYG